MTNQHPRSGTEIEFEEVAISPTSVISPTSTTVTHDNIDGVRKKPSARKIKSCTKRVVVCAVAFAVMFTSFNVAQSYVTTIYPNHGFLSFSLIYGSYACFSLISTILGKRLGGIKRSMFIGSIFYTFYVISINLQSPGLVLFCSVFVGLGAALLWIHQSLFLMKICDIAGEEYVGYYTGLFYAIFNVNSILGNVIAFVALRGGSSMAAMIWIMAVLCAVGNGLLLLVDTSEKVKTVTEVGKDDIVAAKESNTQILSFKERMQPLIDINKQKYFIALIPYMIIQGMGVNFTYGSFPRAIPTDNSSFIPVLFFSYGVSSLIWAGVCGKIFDRFGWKPLLIMHFLGAMLTYWLIIGIVAPYSGIPNAIEPDPFQSGILYPMLLAGFLFGYLDNVMNSIVNMMMLRVLDDMAAPSAVYRIWFCIGNSGISVFAGYVSIQVMVGLNLGGMVLAIVAYLWGFHDVNKDTVIEKKPKQNTSATDGEDSAVSLVAKTNAIGNDEMKTEDGENNNSGHDVDMHSIQQI